MLTKKKTEVPVFEMLKNISKGEMIYRIVCVYFGYPEENVSSRSRKREYVLTRNVAMYLIRHNTDCTLRHIGSIVAKKPLDHTTVLHGIDSICKYLEVSDELDNDIEELQNEIDYTNTLPIPEKKKVLKIDIPQANVIRIETLSPADEIRRKYL